MVYEKSFLAFLFQAPQPVNSIFRRTCVFNIFFPETYSVRFKTVHFINMYP